MRKNTNNSPIRLLREFWYWLTEPDASIREPERRYQTRLLASLLVSFLLLLVLLILMLTLPVRFKPAVSLLQNPDFYLAIGTVFLFVTAYGLNRAGRYTPAAALTVVGLCIGLFARAIVSFAGADPYYDSTNVGVLVYLVLPVFFASVLLSVPVTVIVAAINVIGMLLLSVFFPHLTLVAVFSGPMSFILPIYVLIPLAAHHRNQLEMHRQGEIKRRSEELAALNAIAAAVSQSLDLEEILDAALEETLAVLKAEAGLICLLDKVNQTFAPAVHLGISQDVLQEVAGFKMGGGLSGHVAESGQALVLTDFSADPRTFSPAASREGWRSYAGVPIQSRGKVLAVMALVTRQEGHFRPDHMDLLGNIGSQIGVAIENAQLYQDARKRAAQLAVVNQVARRAASILDPDQLLHAVVTAIQRGFNYYHVGLFLLDEIAGEVEMQAIAGSLADAAPPEHRLALGEGMVGSTAKTGQSLLANDVSQEPRYVLGILKESLTKSELCVPLKLAGKVLGVLDIQSSQLNAFDETDLVAMGTLADQIAVVIENARLHQEIQRQVEQLTFLNRIGRTVTSSLDLEQVLTTVMEETTLVLGTEVGSILLLDEESDELVFEAAAGPRSGEVKGLRLSLGQGIAGWVAQEGRRLLVPNVRKDPRFYSGVDKDIDFITQSILAVPLKVKGKVIGVIEAVNKTEGGFSQADVALLSSMAQSAAIAIENARLYKDLQDRMEELKRTQAQLIQSAKLAAIGELAASVTHELNNPLTSIMGFSRLLLRQVDDADPMKADLELIDREAARTRTIIRGLLDFARQNEPRMEPADVNEIVQSIMPLVRHQANVTKVTIKESYNETLPLVLLDADQIKQVFLNITTNAIQAMPGGGELEVMTAYRPQAHRPEPALSRARREIEGMDVTNCVVAEFHDTGTGISEEDLPHIFDPFFTKKEVGEGTGLGLSVSQGIVERHGGWIEVESKVGQGSTFRVVLPVGK